MKKIITPVIHAALLIPLTGIAVAGEFAARALGVLAEWEDVIDAPLIILMGSIIVIAGIPAFWLTNRLIQSLEELINPTIYDHLRHCLFFYLMIIYSLATWVARGFSGSENDGYLLLWSGISLVALITNYIFLFQKNKTNNT